MYGIIKTSPLLQGTNTMFRSQLQSLADFTAQFQPRHVWQSGPFPVFAHRHVLLRKVESLFTFQLFLGPRKSTMIKSAHAGKFI